MPRKPYDLARIFVGKSKILNQHRKGAVWLAETFPCGRYESTHPTPGVIRNPDMPPVIKKGLKP